MSEQTVFITLLNHPTVYAFTKAMSDLETVNKEHSPRLYTFIHDLWVSFYQRKQHYSFPDFDSTDLLTFPRDILRRFQVAHTWTELNSILQTCHLDSILKTCQLNDIDMEHTPHEERVMFTKTWHKIAEIRRFIFDQIQYVMDVSLVNHEFYLWMQQKQTCL